MNGLDVITITGQGAGPRLLVLGAVHGNERCGPDGIATILGQINDKSLQVTAGAVTFVPVCNPLAYAAQRREVNVNLNRVITPHADVTIPEHGFANQLCDLIGSHDIVLDLHSYHNGREPFLFLDKDDAAHRAFAAALPYSYWVTGWDNIYADAAALNQGDTVAYAHSLGKLGILVECGAHDASDGGSLAAQTIRHALRHFGLVAQPLSPVSAPPTVIEIISFATRPVGATFVTDWQHLDWVEKGTVLSTIDGQAADYAPDHCYLVIPHKDAPIGTEWLYFGVQRT